MLGKFDEGLATLDQVLQSATEEDPREFEFILDIETRMALAMRTLGKVAEADEIERRLASVSDVLNEEPEK